MKLFLLLQLLSVAYAYMSILNSPYNALASSVSFVIPAIYVGYEKVVCYYRGDCCPKERLQPNFYKLSKSLDENVYGQPVVRNMVLKALNGHFRNSQPSKALVLSFHGWTGGGKNYVTKFIAEALYERGMKSPFVHLFLSTVHFPLETKIDIYKLHIQDWIRGNVSRCEQSLFVFDEIDKMPIGMINAIKPFIDYHEEIDGIDFRKAVFIFLSNTGGNSINKKIISIWREGGTIDEVVYSDLENLVQKGAFNEVGGLHHSDVISHSLVDLYVPFLPLQKKHVRECIQDELRKRRKFKDDDFIEKVADSLIYFPPGSDLLSTSGCKMISQRVAYYLSEDELNF